MGSLEKAAIAAAEVVRQQKDSSLYFDGMAIARAVLLAVREPDIDTGLAGAAQVNKNMRGPHKADYCAAKDAFTAMIDAILQEKGDG